MIDDVLIALDFAGFIIGALLAAAVAWWLGLRDPFLLALVSLLVGGPIGALVERFLVKARRGKVAE